MARLTENPFKFGDPVQGDYYCPRPELSRIVRQFLENQVHVVLMGPRRFGKTSFVLDLFSLLEEAGYSCLLVDIFNVTSHRDFLHQVLRALRRKKSLKSKIKDWGKRLGRLFPQLSVDFDSYTGQPTLGLSLGQLADEDVKAAIQDLLDDLANLGSHVVIALDEFQQISQLDDKGWFEATVRSTAPAKRSNFHHLAQNSRIG